jgi:hypothetical protein
MEARGRLGGGRGSIRGRGRIGGEWGRIGGGRGRTGEDGGG